MQIYQIFYNIVLIQVKLTFDRKICGSIFATSINVVVSFLSPMLVKKDFVT